MKYCRKFLAYSILLIAYGFLALPAIAQGEIESSQHVSYQVFENGRTRVRHEIKLTNLTTNFYVSEYSLFLGFTELKNIESYDSQGALRKEVATKENGTDIRLIFNDQVVGKGNILFFTITYDTEEIASKNGRIWEIDIPRIKDDGHLGQYTASLSVPASFGKPTYIKPTLSIDDLVFSKEDVLRGISVVFGEYQLFDYKLNYHLQNNRLYPIETEIALPPQTAYQEVLLDVLTPKPLTVYTDTDGNWLATYRLDGSQKLDVTAFGKVKLFHIPKITQRTTENLADYLTPKPYWDTQDPKIVAKAKELKTPRAIYDYVVTTLSYDYGRIDKNLPRAGASQVMDDPKSAICIEFTDLFIALARAAGIPAREIDGFAYTENPRLRPLSLVKDILHAWPEFYDKEKKVWIAVDPTWGNTGGIEYFDMLDFNHFAFVIKGLDSEYPVSAGGVEKKDVEVIFAKESSFLPKRNIDISTSLARTVVAGIPAKGNIRIENKGNVLLDAAKLTLTAEKVLPASQNLMATAVPPFGNTFVPFSFQSQSYFDNFQTSLKTNVTGQDFMYKVQVSPIYLVYLPWILGGFGAAGLFIVTRVAWHLYFQKRKGASPLRW